RSICASSSSRFSSGTASTSSSPATTTSTNGSSRRKASTISSRAPPASCGKATCGRTRKRRPCSTRIRVSWPSKSPAPTCTSRRSPVPGRSLMPASSIGASRRSRMPRPTLPLPGAFPRLWAFAIEHLLLLPLGAAIALVWVNTSPESYYEFVYAVGFAVNDVAMVFFFALRLARVKSFWPYVLGAGGLSWYALYRGGLHPALALVPIMPLLPHAARDPGFFVDASPAARDALSRFEIVWRHPAQVSLFFFGVVNAGVPFRALEAGTLGLPIATIVGRPLGLLAGAAAALAAGLH